MEADAAEKLSKASSKNPCKPSARRNPRDLLRMAKAKQARLERERREQAKAAEGGVEVEVAAALCGSRMSGSPPLRSKEPRSQGAKIVAVHLQRTARDVAFSVRRWTVELSKGALEAPFPRRRTGRAGTKQFCFFIFKSYNMKQ